MIVCAWLHLSDSLSAAFVIWVCLKAEWRLISLGVWNKPLAAPGVKGLDLSPRWQSALAAFASLSLLCVPLLSAAVKHLACAKSSLMGGLLQPRDVLEVGSFSFSFSLFLAYLKTECFL